MSGVLGKRRAGGDAGQGQRAGGKRMRAPRGKGAAAAGGDGDVEMDDAGAAGKKKEAAAEEEEEQEMSPLCRLGAAEQAVAVNEKMVTVFPMLTVIERAEYELEARFVCKPEERPGKLGEFLKALCKERWQTMLIKPPKAKGKPTVVVVAAAAMRAVNLVRQASMFQEQGAPVGKLFAKHLKVPLQKKFLEEKSLNIVVGTPARLHKLAEIGALDLNRVRYFVVDMHRDAKDLTILDIRDTARDFFELVRHHIRPQLKREATAKYAAPEMVFW